MRTQVGVDGSAARLVSRHLHNLVADARREGLSLEELTIELAAHATCAALSFWTADDLYQIIEAAEVEDDDRPQQDLNTMRPAGVA